MLLQKLQQIFIFCELAMHALGFSINEKQDFTSLEFLSKNKTAVLGIFLFGCEIKTRVVRILVIFQDRPIISHIISKVSARAFH